MTMGKGSSKGFVNLLPAIVLHKMTDLYLMITSINHLGNGSSKKFAVYAYHVTGHRSRSDLYYRLISSVVYVLCMCTHTTPAFPHRMV